MPKTFCGAGNLENASKARPMECCDKLLQILQQMYELLVKHDDGAQKATLTAIRAIRSGNHDAIVKSLNGLEFWGGAGSVCDVVLMEVPWTPEFRRDEADDNRFTLLELDLLHEMERLGIATPNVLKREHAVRWIAKADGLDV